MKKLKEIYIFPHSETRKNSTRLVVEQKRQTRAQQVPWWNFICKATKPKQLEGGGLEVAASPSHEKARALDILLTFLFG